MSLNMPWFDQVKAEKLVLNILKDLQTIQTDIHKNVIDPFSSLFEAAVNSYTYDSWINAEVMRQKQKTLTNKIGHLHEELLACIIGVENLAKGLVVDILCEQKSIIAEVKNKFNTTKGNHKKEIYDDLSKLIDEKYHGFTGYYVEIIPKNPVRYNKQFTPSDNTTKSNRKGRDDIRIIDGYSFYSLLTGDENALFKIHQFVIKKLSEKMNLESIYKFEELFNKAYGNPINRYF
tara:strand:+ start:3449 stop:4147 length:699 start_codon:yes stop_codon:yes gene_type:complete